MAPVQFQDYYATLGLSRDADQKEIKRAFRKKAREHHPDLNRDNPEAESRFKELNEAHEVLSDPEKRSMYDRYGSDWERYKDCLLYTSDAADDLTRVDLGGRRIIKKKKKIKIIEDK